MQTVQIRMALSMIHSLDNIRADLLEIYGEKFANKIDIHIADGGAVVVTSHNQKDNFTNVEL